MNRPGPRTTHSADGPLVYDRWGGGRPVLLVHGLLFDRTMWWPVAAELAAHCTVIAPDLPGHGESRPREDCSPARVAEDLAALVDGLGLRLAPVIVGHGPAAWLATTFAGTYATRATITVDEPDAAPETVDDLIAASHLDEVPGIFRDYARPRRDPALLKAYDGWRPTPRPVPRPTPPAAGRFRHLGDPLAFAAEVRAHL